MVYDFINLCAGVASPTDDENGTLTVEYLKLCRRVMRLLLSNHPSSVGLHPAIYFYSWTGKQQPILFLVTARMMIDYDRANKLPMFIERRERFEAFLMAHRSLGAQIIRKFGSKSSGAGGHLRDFYDTLLEMIGQGFAADKILVSLSESNEWKYLQPAESPYEGASPTRYSTQVKAGLVMRELLPSAPRCEICRAVIPTQAISIDHKERQQDGGASTPINAQLTHPYCNTGYKESKHAKATKAK
jgi:hypothetical protein